MLLYLKQEHKEKKKKGVILDYSVWVCFIFNKKKKKSQKLKEAS